MANWKSIRLVESSAFPEYLFLLKVPKPDPVKHPPPTARRFYFTEPAVLLGAIYSSRPTSSPTLLMHLLSQATVDIHHAALSLLPRLLRLRAPLASIPSFPRGTTGFTSTSTNPNVPKLLVLTTPSNRPGADGDGGGDVDDYAEASGQGISPYRPRKDTEGRPYHHPHDYSPFRRQCELWIIWRSRTTTSPITKSRSRRRCG